MSIPPVIVRRHHGEAYCTTEYVPAERWLRTTWRGFITSAEAEDGALGALEGLRLSPLPYLLNDNSQVQGPWFDSVEWLQREWAPQAKRLGLRYVAHVAQPHTEADLDQVLMQDPFAGHFELQFFSAVEDASAWLRDCQRYDALHAGGQASAPGADSAAAAA